jgi:beta-mannanase
VAISALYLSWNKGFNPGMYNANARIGRISFITWEYMQWQAGPMQGYEDLPLQAILDGRHDPYLLDWAEGVRDFDLPIFIRWGHEMNGDWYPWSGIFNGAGTLDGFGDPGKADGPERFVAAYQYIHDLFESAGAENVLWVWCPNAPFSVMESVYSPWNTASAYYPGDEYVDWLCFDGYNWGTSAFGQSFNSTWASFDEIFAESYRELQALNPDKPIIIGEFASTEDGGDKAAWITDAFESVKSDYPQIRALIWFHIAKETDWRINSSPEAFAAFQRAVSGPYWLETWLDFEGQ